MPNLKLSDIEYGTLNNIRENDSNASGDRRRTSPVTALRFATEKAFEKDTLLGINEFNGIVLHRRIVTYASYRNRTSLLNSFVKTSANNDPPDANQNVYKVLIPELEPRPTPLSLDDPVIATYQDIYSDVAGEELEAGQLVVIKYEDVGNLFNPRIVRVIGKPLLIGEPGDGSASNRYSSGIPTELNDLATPNADKLRKALSKLGYEEKEKEISKIGDIDSNISYYGEAVFKKIKEQHEDIMVRVTGGNDRTAAASRHSKGRALDFTISPTTNANLDKIVDILQGFSAGDGNFRFLDEYRYPSEWADGLHFHMSYWSEGGSEGSQNAATAKRRAASGEINVLVGDL